MLNFYLCHITEIHLRVVGDPRVLIRPRTGPPPRNKQPRLELGQTAIKVTVERDDIDNFVDAVAPDDEIIIPDNLDGAFLGISAEEEPPRAVYSIEKCINILRKDMTADEAEEYFWYNVAGASGHGFPLYISTPED